MMVWIFHPSNTFMGNANKYRIEPVRAIWVSREQDEAYIRAQGPVSYTHLLGLVTPAIADIGKEAGKMLVITTLVAYGATLFSGFLSYFTGVTLLPSMIAPGAPIEQISEAHDLSLIHIFLAINIDLRKISMDKILLFTDKVFFFVIITTLR